jgi:hypothetical protein
LEPERAKVHIAQIDFIELYSPCFSDTSAAEEFYSRVKAASPQNNEALVLFHQAARMIWLADRVDEVARGRPAFQILFYLIAAELIAKTAFRFEGDGQSREFVRRFFEQLCADEAPSRLARAFMEPSSGSNLSLRQAVDFLYDIRCDVVHRGQYYGLSLPREEDAFPVLVPNGESYLTSDLRIWEIRKIVLEGAIRGARILLEDSPSYSATPPGA